jgi:arsenite methyltransferase
MTQDTSTVERVRERYASAARQVQAGQAACCSPSPGADPITGGIYGDGETIGLPEDAVKASLGCGNPTALIDLHEGETVLDLGSGGGIDVLLSAKRVGPTGFAYGLDMTDEMLQLAQANKEKAGAKNVAFLRGSIEDIPLPSRSVDVVISNCVINLAPDKSLVLKEAFRVLRDGGRFAVADVVAEGPLPEELRRDMEAWVGCLAGALDIDVYRGLLGEAGFEEIAVEVIRRYTAEAAGFDGTQHGAESSMADGRLASAFIRATKPIRVATQKVDLVASSAGCGTSGCCRER